MQHRISGDLTSSKLNGILIQVLGELTALYSHNIGLTPIYTIALAQNLCLCFDHVLPLFRCNVTVVIYVMSHSLHRRLVHYIKDERCQL